MRWRGLLGRASPGAALLRRDLRVTAGAAVLLVFFAMAAVGPLFVQLPDALVGVPHQPPSSSHWLGTTGQGQDVLAQLVCGTRVTLAIGFGVGLLVTAIGALLGVTAGYFGGRVDAALSLLINVFLVLPGLPLAIVLAAYVPPGPLTVALVLVITSWAWGARVVRAQTMSLRERDFVLATVVGGETPLRIIAGELMPNLLPLLIAQAIGATSYAIGAEVGLEFLGLGDLSAFTWGTNLYWATNDSALLTGAWWTFVPSGLCVALVGFALTLLNSGFDELGNPRLQQERAFRAVLARAGVPFTRSTPVVPRPSPGAAA